MNCDINIGVTFFQAWTATVADASSTFCKMAPYPVSIQTNTETETTTYPDKVIVKETITEITTFSDGSTSTKTTVNTTTTVTDPSPAVELPDWAVNDLDRLATEWHEEEPAHKVRHCVRSGYFPHHISCDF